MRVRSIVQSYMIMTYRHYITGIKYTVCACVCVKSSSVFDTTSRCVSMMSILICVDGG